MLFRGLLSYKNVNACELYWNRDVKLTAIFSITYVPHVTRNGNVTINQTRQGTESQVLVGPNLILVFML